MLDLIIDASEHFNFLVDQNYLDFPHHLVAFEEDLYGDLYLIQKDWVFTKTPVDLEMALFIVKNLPDPIYYL
jgi:hypothetical protein